MSVNVDTYFLDNAYSVSFYLFYSTGIGYYFHRLSEHMLVAYGNMRTQKQSFEQMIDHLQEAIFIFTNKKYSFINQIGVNVLYQNRFFSEILKKFKLLKDSS